MKADAVVVGLGNPGPKYRFTRHNIGFLFLDVLTSAVDISFNASSTLAKALQAEVAEYPLLDLNLLLIKPQTFMNLSGKSVRALYTREPHLKQVPLIVFHDEADLDLGRLRVKFGGGDAGHNGLKSIRAEIGTGDYYRVRMGVGRPTPESNMGLADHVLANFRPEEQNDLILVCQRCEEVLEPLAKADLKAALEVASHI